MQNPDPTAEGKVPKTVDTNDERCTEMLLRNIRNAFDGVLHHYPAVHALYVYWILCSQTAARGTGTETLGYSRQRKGAKAKTRQEKTKMKMKSPPFPPFASFLCCVRTVSYDEKTRKQKQQFFGVL